MNHFESLREQAKAKRDATIAKARRDYKQALKQIAALKMAIVGNPTYREHRPAKSQPALREIIVAVVGNRKLTLTEVTVGVLEAGFASAMPKKGLRKYVAKILSNDERFKREGAKWSLTIVSPR